MVQTNENTSSTTRPMAMGIHRGANTHHHDQVMLPESFNATKTTVNSSDRVIPPVAATGLSISKFLSGLVEVFLGGEELPLLVGRCEGPLLFVL